MARRAIEPSLCCLYYAGLRDADVVRLDVDDVRLSARKGELRVLGKGSDGGKPRTVPVQAELRAVLQAWLDERSGWPRAGDTPALLLNRRGGRLSDRSVRTIIEHLGELAGLDDDPLEPFGPHVLRHTFGTQLVRAGVDLVTVAELMGHARLETTRIYTRPICRGLRKVDLAQAIGVTPAAVTHYEQGHARPKEAALAALAALALHLSFPPAFFQRGRPMHRMSEAEVHFRSLRSTRKMDRDRLLARLSLLLEVVAQIEEVVALPQVTLPSLPIADDAEAEDTAELAAADVRRRWGLGGGPIQHVVRLLELKGVIVVRPTVGTRSVQEGCSTVLGRPIVVLASDKQDGAQSRMDASHELGHLIMHHDAEPGRQSIERQARRFASAFLLPREAMLAELPRQARLDAFLSLKARWGVSVAALLYRAKTLSILSPHAYQRAQAKLAALGWRVAEPDAGAPEEANLLPRALRLMESRRRVTLGDLALRLRMHESDLAQLLCDAIPQAPSGPQLQVL